MIHKIGFLLVAGVVVGATGIAAAQEPLLGQYFGAGVHAFNGGNYLEAQKSLTAAIDAGTKDPRCFYFRGLSFLRSGLEKDAISDFKKGAELETADVNQMFPVGRSLERIQGRDRIVLEEYRAQARMANFARQQKERESRYQARKRAEEAVMRQIPAPSEPPASKAGGAAAPKPANAGVDPFGGEPAGKSEPPAAKGGAAGTDPFAPAADPFSGDSKPAPMPKPAAGTDPFGGGDANPKPPAANPPANEDPFGGGGDTKPAPMPKEEAPKAEAPKADAGNDPFGGGGDAKPKPPAANPPANEDPFGGAGGDPKPAPLPKAEAPKAEAPKADVGSDPFGGGDAKPKASAANPPANDDPFGGGGDAKPAPTPKAEAPKAEAPKADAGNDPFGGANVQPDTKPAGDGPKVSGKGLLSVFGSMIDSMADDGNPKGPAPVLIGEKRDVPKPAESGFTSWRNVLIGEKRDVPKPDVPRELPAGGDAPAPGNAKPVAVDDPFGVPAVAPKKEVPPAGDPFGAPEMPKKPVAKDDPFKDDSVQSSPKPSNGPAKPEPKPADDDPFGK